MWRKAVSVRDRGVGGSNPLARPIGLEEAEEIRPFSCTASSAPSSQSVAIDAVGVLVRQNLSTDTRRSRATDSAKESLRRGEQRSSLSHVRASATYVATLRVQRCCLRWSTANTPRMISMLFMTARSVRAGKLPPTSTRVLVGIWSWWTGAGEADSDCTRIARLPS